MADATSSPAYAIQVGRKVDDSDFMSFVIERDMFQPDMATVVLSNQGAQYSGTKIGDPVEIKVGDDPTSIYKGTVTGLEPVYKGGEKTRIVIRAMNKFHQMSRQTKTRTWQKKTDRQILGDVAGDAGLSLQWKHDTSIQYEHVYQHNVSNLEFVRMLATRMGCHVWCVGDQLFVKQPELDASPIATFGVGSSGGDPNVGSIKSFTPRLSAASIVKKVTVKGWNPQSKEEIRGEYSSTATRLGSEHAVKAAGNHANEDSFTVDHPIWSPDEAKALAKARFVDLQLGYITGECEVTGDPRMDLVKIVQLDVSADPDTADSDPFNGRYYIMGVTHRYAVGRSRDGGYSTTLRLARDAQKK